MPEKIHVLQLGQDWRLDCSIPDKLQWHRLPPEKIDVLIVEKPGDLAAFEGQVDPYRSFYLDQDLSEEEGGLVFRMQARSYSLDQRQDLLADFSRYFFGPQYGDRLQNAQIYLEPAWQQACHIVGSYRIDLEANFGPHYQPLLSWKYNIPIEQGQVKSFWLEYQKEDHIFLRVRMAHFVGLDLHEEVFLESPDQPWDYQAPEAGYLVFSLEVKGQGHVSISSLHQRLSRGPYGWLIPGGQRLVDSKGQEIFAYFHPGDGQGPLNVYFSGYRPAQGFEGLGMMASFGAPFLIFSDPRLEGGAFYLGSHDLESQIKKTIQTCLDQLGLAGQQLILSGLSMGTFAALYYGAQLNPRAIICGKPLTQIGLIAQNYKRKRPNEFATALDILLEQGPDEEELDQAFWSVFQQADWTGKIVAIAYMEDDDYDDQAYPQILERLEPHAVRLISKSRPGRHNDDTAAMVDWFRMQYRTILRKEFKRP